MRSFPAPDSFGDSHPIREFNPCHGDGGKFTVKGQGRCLGVEARLAARREHEGNYGIFGSKALRVPDLLGIEGVSPSPEVGNIKSLARYRKGVRKLAQKIPNYLKKDVQDAAYADSAVTSFERREGFDKGESSGYAFLGKRHAEVTQNKGTKTEVLSALRHELGHIDRTPLGKGGLSLGKLRLNPTIAEEVRAWKNAIRNSGGKVDFKFIKYALGTYFHNEPVVGERVQKRLAKMSLFQSLAGMKDPSKIYKEEREAFVEEHVLPVLRRYRDRVRRAARKAK